MGEVRFNNLQEYLDYYIKRIVEQQNYQVDVMGNSIVINSKRAPATHLVEIYD